MDPDAVRVRCNTETLRPVDDIKEELLSRPAYFSDVEVKDAKPDPKSGGVDFRMTMKLNKDLPAAQRGGVTDEVRPARAARHTTSACRAANACWSAWPAARCW